MENKLCSQCNQWKPIESFSIAFENVNFKNGYKQNNKRKNRCKTCYAKRERLKLIIDAFNALGWTCSCCGEDDIRFLSLDHIEGNGGQQRKELNLNCQQIYRLARQQGFPKDKWQILCMNCNSARWQFDGICPHRLGKKEEYKQEQIDFINHSDQSFRQNYNKQGLKGIQQSDFDKKLSQLFVGKSPEEIIELTKKLSGVQVGV